MNIEEGYGFVGPRTEEIAKALLEAAEAVGEDPSVVRTTVGGFIAPDGVVKYYEKTTVSKEGNVADKPDENAIIIPGGPDNTVPGGEAPDNTLPSGPNRPDQGLPPEQGGQPDQGLPGEQPGPDQGLPGEQPGIDNSLPGQGGQPDQGLPGEQPGPDQGLPGEQPGIDNSLPGQGGRPDQGLPGEQPGIDNTLPGEQPGPDQGLPGEQPGIDNTLPGEGGRPDQGLPEQPGGELPEGPQEPTYPEGTPNENWTVAQIKQYAADNGIDLAGAAKKDDILVAVRAEAE